MTRLKSLCCLEIALVFVLLGSSCSAPKSTVSELGSSASLGARDDGTLELINSTNVISNVSRDGSPLSIGGWLVFRNKSKESVELVQVVARDVDDGLDVLGTRVYFREEQTIPEWLSSTCGFPPTRLKSRPVSGVKVPAGSEFALLIGVDTSRSSGTFEIGRIEVGFKSRDGDLFHTDVDRTIGITVIDSTGECNF